jgi:hypothetical protein
MSDTSAQASTKTGVPAKPPAAAPSGGSSGSGPGGGSQPPFIMTDVTLLFQQMSAPESDVTFNPPSRANSATVQSNISPPTWIWATSTDRLACTTLVPTSLDPIPIPLTQDDAGKYGVQLDVNIAYQLIGVAPINWQPIRTGFATWVWTAQNPRSTQTVSQNDVGKFGIDQSAAPPALYQLTGVNPDGTGTWQPISSISNGATTAGLNTSSPFELSVGAADADSFHDFYRLQIAFEDVWSELFDGDMQQVAQQLYAQWDALMDPGLDDTGATGRKKTFSAAPASTISGADELQDFITFLESQFGLLDPSTSPPPILELATALSNTLLACNMLLIQLDRTGQNVGTWGANQWTNDQNGNQDTLATGIFLNLPRSAYFTTINSDVQSFINDITNSNISPPFLDLATGLSNTLLACNMLLLQLYRVGGGSFGGWLNDHDGNQDTLATGIFQGLPRSAYFTTTNNDVQTMIGTLNQSNAPPPYLEFATDLSNTLLACNMLLFQTKRVCWNDDWLRDGDSEYPSNQATLTTGIFANLPRAAYFVVINNQVQGLIAGLPTTAASDAFLELNQLLQSLDSMLKEKYRFDVFAPDSINYGLVLNYRQHWQPQSYQVGNLVSTIPLAPQETRRYTTKTVVKKTRNVKEISENLRSGKDESSDTDREDSQIVNRAKNQTNSQKNASGSFGNDAIYKVSAGLQEGTDQSVESAQTKQDIHESVVKAAQEYRNEHRMEISTEVSTDQESTSYREIRNPNDELTVTYLFYELQRRYLVNEWLNKVTPVILVANDVPAPHEVDQSWLLRHDWILKRAILDDSFLPALEYLSTNYTGEELTLKVLGLAVEQQKALVDRLSLQVQAANDALNASAVNLQDVQNQDIADMQQAQTFSLIKSFFDPLNITQTGNTDGNADRAAVQFAQDNLDRAQTKVNQLLSQLRGETTALQVAIDKYTKAATQHFSLLADIDRLRIHVKDNIIYYMQAIWSYEPPDQRYFRLYNLDVPVFASSTTVTAAPAGGLANADATNTTLSVNLPPPTLVGASAAAAAPPVAAVPSAAAAAPSAAAPAAAVAPPEAAAAPAAAASELVQSRKLHQVADIDTLMGFKGNYMIFPLVEFDYMTWFMIQNYINLDDTTGVTAVDPDPLAGLTIDQLKAAMANIHAQDPQSFSENQQAFEQVISELLSVQEPQMVIVPSNSLYIEALPGTHPLLEDFKLIHRAIDVKKAQAEARRAELENLRLAARLAAGEYGEPHIDKVVVVGQGQNVTVDAGQ